VSQKETRAGGSWDPDLNVERFGCKIDQRHEVRADNICLISEGFAANETGARLILENLKFFLENETSL